MHSKNHPKTSSSFALISALLILSVLTVVILGFLSLVSFERRISQSSLYAQKSYYLAEAGIAEAVWKLKNDAAWKSNFETNPAWSDEFTRVNPLGVIGSYTVQIQNTDLARGELISTAQVNIGGGKSAQRVIRAVAFKALGESAIDNSALFSNNDINFSLWTDADISGRIFARDDILLNIESNLAADNDVKARDWIISTGGSSLSSATAVYADHCTGGGITPWPCLGQPEDIAMPAVDFENYKAQADHIYSEEDFANLLEANPNLVLNGIIYVTGRVRIKRGQSLIINGLLLADENIEAGLPTWPPSGESSLVVNDPGGPSGIVSKERILFSHYLTHTEINGTVYANDTFQVYNFWSWPSFYFKITGAVVARKIKLAVIFHNLEFEYSSIGEEVFGGAADSPTITVEHWEEEY